MTYETERIAALVQEGTAEAAARLQEIAETADDKAARKEARRALFRLSQAGVPLPEARMEAAAHESRTAQPDLLRAYASAYDGAGNQMLFCILSDPDGGSPTFSQIITNDTEGIYDFGVRKMPRVTVTTVVEKYLAELEEGLALAEIESDYARWLLARAQQTHRQKGRRAPDGFLPWIARIGQAKQDYDLAPVYAHLPAESLRDEAGTSRDPETLFGLPWFDAWYLAAEDVVGWLAAWDNIEHGTLVLPDSAKADRRERIVTEAVGILLTPELRARYARRLEDSADMLRRRDKTEAARMALVHALILRDDTPIMEVPFARVLIRRTLEAARDLWHQNEEARRTETPAT